MATWPATLPQSPLIDGFKEEPASTLIQTQMEVGPPNTRRRGTAGESPVEISFIMTEAQVDTLDTFYKDTILMGALPFDFTHPRKGTVSLKTDTPRYTPASHNLWEVKMKVRIQP